MRLPLLPGATLLVISLAAAGATMPVAVVEPGAHCHQSIDDAAIAGILAAVAASSRVEYGGAVLRRAAGCFIHSTPVTSNQPARLEYRIRLVRGMALVGIFHTHTPGGHAGAFSPDDMAVQRRLGVPSYIGVLGSPGCVVAIRSLGSISATSPSAAWAPSARRLAHARCRRLDVLQQRLQ